MPRKQLPNQIGISFLMDKEDHKIVTQKAKDYGFESLAAYFKFTALNAQIKVKVKAPTT